MPDVPFLPGVPPLPSYGASNVSLLLGDAAIIVSQFLQPVWGIFFNGTPVIQPASPFTQQIPSIVNVAAIASALGVPNVLPCIASTAEFEYSADSPISDVTQENGAFQSYDKVQLPFDIKMKLAVRGPSNRQALLSTAEAMRASILVYDIVTPDRTYTSCNCKHVDYRRTATNGVDMLIVDMWFEEVRTGSPAIFTSTQQPGAASTQSIGNVQPQPAPSSVAQGFAGVGGAPY